MVADVLVGSSFPGALAWSCGTRFRLDLALGGSCPYLRRAVTKGCASQGSFPRACKHGIPGMSILLVREVIKRSESLLPLNCIVHTINRLYCTHQVRASYLRFGYNSKSV